MDGRPEAGERREMLGHAVAHVPLEAVAGMRQAEPHHQPVAGDLGDDRGRRHRRTSASPETTASQSQPQSIFGCRRRRRACGATGSALTARASAQSEARRILSRSMRSTVPKATATCARGADFLVELFARGGVELLGIVEAARDALGSRITAAATTGPASGPLPASSQPATGNMPFVERAPLAPEGRAQDRLVERQALGGGFAAHGRARVRGNTAKSIAGSRMKCGRFAGCRPGRPS